MKRDSMEVLMYKALKYLYMCMRKGEEPNEDMLGHDGELFGDVPYPYWAAIWCELVDMGLVKGVKRLDTVEGTTIAFSSPRITFAGKEFLNDNSTMHKAAKFVKAVKPGVSIG